MFDRIFTDGGDLAPILIYLVIFVIWAVGKALTAIKKNQTSAPGEQASRPTRGGKRLDPSLKEFLETLTGQTIETEPAPAPAPPVRPVAQPPRRPPPVMSHPQPIQPVPEPVFDIAAQAEDIYRTREAPANVIETTEIGEHDHFQEQTLGSLSALAGMTALQMPMRSLHLPIQRENCDHRNPVHIRGPRSARRAMIERIILGPPRSLSTDPEDKQTLGG